eukprot:jgi/Bigna1/87087/estExt_fgenesh1_pg.C_160196
MTFVQTFCKKALLFCQNPIKSDDGVYKYDVVQGAFPKCLRCSYLLRTNQEKQRKTREKKKKARKQVNPARLLYNKMMEFSLAQVISDAIKCLLAIFSIAWGINQIRGGGNRASQIIRKTSVISAAMYLLLVIGAKEPLYFGWEAFNVLNGTFLALLLFNFMNLCLYITDANYMASNLTYATSKRHKLLYNLGVGFIIIVDLVAVVLILVQDKLYWTGLTNLALVLAINFGASTALHSLYGLYKMLCRRRDMLCMKELSMPIPESKSSNPGYTRQDSNNSSRLGHLHIQKTSSLPNDSTCSKEQRCFEKNHASMDDVKSRPTSNNAMEKAYTTVSPSSTYFRKEGFGSPTSLNRQETSTSGGYYMKQKVLKFRSLQNAQEERARRKIYRLVIIGVILYIIITILLIGLVISAFSESGSYSESRIESRAMYDPVEDVIRYLVIFVNFYFQYYSSSSRNNKSIENKPMES